MNRTTLVARVCVNCSTVPHREQRVPTLPVGNVGRCDTAGTKLSV